MFTKNKIFMVQVKCYYEPKKYRIEQFMVSLVNAQDFLDIVIMKGKELVPNTNWVKIEKVFTIKG